jgi:serine/threonine protein phosphatase PrpC
MVYPDQAAGLPVRWAVLTRPGNDPMKRVKENQDSCVVIDEFAGRKNHMFFGMYDGHGPNGALASQVRDAAIQWITP